MEPFTKDLLERAKGLVGSVLLDARSYDAPGGGLTVGQSDAGGNIATHFAVDLCTDHGVVSVISSEEWTNGTHELGLLEQPHLHLGNVASISLQGDPRWDSLIGHEISSARIHWIESPYIAVSKRRRSFNSHHFDVDGAVPFSGPKAPSALELHFEGGGRVLLVSGSWLGVDQPIVDTGVGISFLWEGATFSTLVPNLARGLKRSW